MDLGSWGWKGLFSRALEFPSAVIPGVFTAEVSPTQRCRLRYNDVAKVLELSVDSGAYVAIGTAVAAGGWTDDGANVRLTTAADTVSMGTATPIAGTKVVVSAPQLVTGGIDVTEGMRITLVQSVDMGAFEEQTGIHIIPGGRAGDNPQSAYTAFFADAPQPTGSLNKAVLFVSGNAAGAEFWDSVVTAVDNDLLIESVRQTPGAPDDLILQSEVAGVPSGEIRAQTNVGGVIVVHWSVDDATGFRARSLCGRSGSITPSIAASQNDFNPAGLAGASWIICGQTAGANVDITGLAGGYHGREVTLTNASDVATNTITLTNEDGASAAANRFHNEDLVSVVIARGGSVELRYDGGISRWRPLYT